MFYTCTTPNCAIALSKATFPVAMNCPVCQVPLELQAQEAILTPEDQSLLESLPYVIAYPLKRTLEEKHAWTKINLLKDTFLNYLKYLGLLTASEFFNSDLKNRRMVDAFQKNLAQPSFGSWNAFIRECITFLKEQNHTFFYPELLAYYETIETGPKRKLYKGEIEYIDSNGDAQLKKQETTAIGLLINFRNRYLGHGLTLDDQASQHLWEEYFPVFKTLLEQLSFAKEYPMLKREHGETYLLQGAELKEINSAHILDGSIWIENKQGEAFEILPFYIVPGALALAKEDKEQVLSYESFTGKTIKFFSPEGSEKQTSGVILDKLNLLLRNKQKETSFTSETFTKEVFLTRIVEENKLVIDTLIQEKKVIEGIYQHRETIEVKLREWIGVRANIFFIAAEAGSGKTNLLVEIQKQYTERQLPSLFIRAARMEKSSLKEQIAYQLNLDTSIDLKEYKSIAGTQADPTFILIDGLNEASNAEAIWFEILEISTLFEPGSVKFVITNRANSKSDLERYHLSEEQEQFIYSDSKERDNEKGLASHVFWLTPMDMKEMEGAWEFYVKKDKKRFKPLFSFNDLASFDRGLYLQINNPLVLRIFLETYQGKDLPEKGVQHLHIWKDWFATFTVQEQKFMRLLADTIWEKGENEIELEALCNDEQLKSFILTDNISGPYHRLLNLGWVSRFHKDLTIYVGFTVEGLLFYLLGLKLDKQESEITIGVIDKLLVNGGKLQKVAIDSFLYEQALKGELELITQLIDEGEEKLETSVIPLIYSLKSNGTEKTIKKLLENQTENDWKALLKLDNRLKELELHILRKEFLKEVMFYNSLDSKNKVWLGLNAIGIFAKNESLIYLNKIEDSFLLLNKDSDILLNLGECELEFGNFDKALDYFNKSLIIQIKKNGEFNNKVALTYNEIGVVLREKGEYEKSMDYHNKSLKICSTIFGDDHFEVGESYANIGSVFFSKGEFESALDYNIKSLNIYIKQYGHTHSTISTIYNNIGIVIDAEGDYDKAIYYYNKSIDIALLLFGSIDSGSARIYHNLGLTYSKMGDFDKSLEFLNKSMVFQMDHMEQNHVDLAGTYSSLGRVWIDKEDYEKALYYYNKSLEIRLEKLGANHPLVEISYNGIGLVYNCKGEFDKALDFLFKGLNVALINFGEIYHGVATNYNNIGLAFHNKNNYDLAFDYYDKALDIYLKTLGSEHIGICMLYSNLGRLWSEKEEYDKSLEFYNKWLSIYIKTFGLKHQFIADIYFQLGNVYDCKGEIDIALSFFEKCLTIQLENFDNIKNDVAKTFFYLGDALKNLKKFKFAIENFKKGFEIQQKGGYPFKIAQCYEALNDQENALDYYIQSSTLRKEDPEVGLEAESTQEAISNAKRLAKELAKENDLLEWMKNIN